MKYIKNIFILSILSLTFISCQEQNSPQIQTNKIEIGYINLKKEPVKYELELNAKIKANSLALVRPQISGIIEKQLFVDGSYVEAGDILYKIENSSYKAALSQNEALLSSAKANQISSEAKSKRADELLKFDGISKQEFDDIKASYLQAKALVEQRTAELKASKIDLERCEIKAPISGYIGISKVTIGSLVNANQSDALVDIKDTKTIFADMTQSYSEILALKNIINFNDKIELSLIFDDGAVYPYKGELKAKELGVDESSQTVTLRAVFPNPENLLLSGMMVKARLEAKNSIQAYLIPQQAVLRDQKANPIITLITNENKTLTKIIKTQRTIGNKWLVLDGIDENDKVIIEGLNKINSRSEIVAKDLNSKYKD